MAKTVKISDTLFELAKAEAETMHRSVPMQLEYWCIIASNVEKSGIPMPLLAEIARAEPSEGSAARIYELLLKHFRAPDVQAVRNFQQKLAETRVTLYESDPDHPGVVVAIYPDGRREMGHFTGKGFEPVQTATRRIGSARR